MTPRSAVPIMWRFWADWDLCCRPMRLYSLDCILRIFSFLAESLYIRIAWVRRRRCDGR